MTEQRPSPEEMLVRAVDEEARSRRGHLKVFFGMAPGVGKTYAMLEEGLQKQREGVDVVVGYVETHGRPETEALAQRLSTLPSRSVPYRGVELREFDLDAALARRPGLLLVDELPHTNAPGSRHVKRWQDVDELLEAGIHVYTTLNVQHLESMNDVVQRITGVVVRETVPDALFDKADEIELLDLPPDALLQRLEEGKVYLGDASVHAASNFFQKGNLIALRELALRRSTERVDAQVDAWRREHGIADAWSTGERLLVAVGPGPRARDVVRSTYRMASRLHAPWVALHVESGATDALPDTERERIHETLEFAEQLGAESAVVRGESVADEIVRVCRQRNVSRVVLGRPTYDWRSRWRGTLVKALVRQAEGIDVLVTSGMPEEERKPRTPVPRQLAAPAWEWIEALGWIGAATLLEYALDPVLDDADRAMVYLLAVAVAATRVGAGPSFLAAVAGVAAFDFLFVAPRYTFSIGDARYGVTFFVMLAVGVLVGRLTMRIRRQASSAVDRERRTAALYALSRELATETDPAAIARTAARHIHENLASETVLWVPAEHGLQALHGGGHPIAAEERDVAVARWVLEHARPAGTGTDTLPEARALYLPLVGSVGTIGVLALVGPPLQTEQRLLADTFTRQSALALERALLAAQAEQARIAVETERLRNELLSAVSHDLRTPLASITGSATALLDTHLDLGMDARRELLQTIREESEHLGRLVADLLDLTRIESGTVRARLSWVPVEEVIDVALGRLETQLAGREVRVDVPKDMLSAPMDATLVGQVLLNLLENAAKHTPRGRPIDVVAQAHDGKLRIDVLDRGDGIPPGEEERIFDKFYRTADGQRVPGTGLGLAIARAVVRAHGGTIHAANRDGGGAQFVIELPLDRSPT